MNEMLAEVQRTRERLARDLEELMTDDEVPSVHSGTMLVDLIGWLRFGDAHVSGDLSDVATMTSWSLANGYKPYAIFTEVETGELVELISFPWWEDERVQLYIRTPGDEGSLRRIDNPQLILSGPVSR